MKRGEIRKEGKGREENIIGKVGKMEEKKEEEESDEEERRGK